MSIFFSDDDDVMVIALWIIAIGFIILAIDKTTKLNNPPAKSDSQPANGSACQKQLPGCQAMGNHDDPQFDEIQKQLRQLREGIHSLINKINT